MRPCSSNDLQGPLIRQRIRVFLGADWWDAAAGAASRLPFSLAEAAGLLSFSDAESYVRDNAARKPKPHLPHAAPGQVSLSLVLPARGASRGPGRGGSWPHGVAAAKRAVFRTERRCISVWLEARSPLVDVILLGRRAPEAGFEMGRDRGLWLSASDARFRWPRARVRCSPPAPDSVQTPGGSDGSRHSHARRPLSCYFFFLKNGVGRPGEVSQNSRSDRPVFWSVR